MIKPYIVLPNYADVGYIDGKLKVASSIIRNTNSEKTRRNWLHTVDILLDQRTAMLEVESASNR